MASKKDWTSKDEQIGKQFLKKDLEEYDQGVNFLIRMNEIAGSLGYGNYSNKKLGGVRSYIASEAAKARKNLKQNKLLMYAQDLKEDEGLLHSRHPDEDVVDLNDFF